jgi:hypothetical protein
VRGARGNSRSYRDKWQDTALKLGFDGLDAAIAWGEDRGRGRDQMPGDDYNRMPPSPDMVVVYYERLLRKYIDHIRQAEGNDLIDRIGEKFFSNVEFTDEEKATLMRLAGKGATDAAAE